MEAGDRSASLNSFAAAERFYMTALELTARDDRQWPYITIRHARIHWSAGVRGGDRQLIQEVVDALLSADDRDAAADAKEVLAGVIWNEGDSAGAAAEIGNALELLRDQPPSPVKARLLAESARGAMLAGDQEGAIRFGREGLELAESLGLDPLRASLLNTIGVARIDLGDPAGLGDVERSLAIALEAVDPGEIHRAYNNLGEEHKKMGNWPESSRLLREMRKADERFGSVGSLRWDVGEEAIDGYYTGDWDKAVASADELIAGAEAGSAFYLEPVSRTIRARIRLARGDEDGSLDDSAKAVEHARGSDPQVLGPALAGRALVLLGLGDREQASDLTSQALEVGASFYQAIDLATALHDLGRCDEIEVWATALSGGPWQEAARAIARGDFHQAAEILGPTGNVAEEAYCRLRSGADADVRKALEFYRSVGATRYVREGEALLAKSA